MEVQSQFIEMFGDPMTNTKGWTEYGYIGNYSQIVLGSTPNSKNPSYWDGDIKWITPAEMTDESYYIYDTERHLTEEGLRSANLTLLPYGSVLFSTRAPIGKVGLVGSPMYCNQGFKNFICNDNLNPVYLYYTLIYKHDYLVSLGTGTTFKELSKKAVDNLEIAIPPLELQEQFECIYHQSDKSKFVGFKSQFIEMFGKGNWEQKCLGEIGTFKRGGGFQKSDYVEHGIPCIHYGQIHTKFGPFIYSHITEISTDLEPKTKFASKGDLIIAITSEDTEGSCKSTAWLGDYPVAVGGHAAIFHHCMNPLYMSFFFKSTLFNYAKMEYIHGTKVFEVKPDDIAKILVPCPPMSLQKQFSVIARQADKSKLVGHCSMNAMNVEISKLINKKILII